MNRFESLYHNFLKERCAVTIACPECSSQAYKKNGYTRHGKQNHRCLECGRQFSIDPEEEKILIEKGANLVAVRVEERQLENIC